MKHEVRLETPIKKEIAAYLDSLGPEKCWHVPFHNVGYTRKGIPDRLVCYRGHFFAIEVKRSEKAEPTAWQARELAGITKAGGRALVAWDVAHVKQIIAELDAYEARVDELCLE